MKETSSIVVLSSYGNFEPRYIAIHPCWTRNDSRDGQEIMPIFKINWDNPVCDQDSEIELRALSNGAIMILPAINYMWTRMIYITCGYLSTVDIFKVTTQVDHGNYKPATLWAPAGSSRPISFFWSHRQRYTSESISNSFHC